MAYREVHVLLEELADATLEGTRKEYLAEMASVPLLILDDLGMRNLLKCGPRSWRTKKTTGLQKNSQSG